MIVTGLIGIGLGVLGALKGGAAARSVDALGLIGVAVPGFLIGLLLIVVFAVRLRWLPFGGYTPLSDGLGAWAAALVLPVAALAIGSIGLVAKQVRASMVDALSSEFVLTFTANGFRRSSIVYRHALRSAAVPVLAVMGVTLVGLLGGSVIIEQVFGIPGIGGLAVQSTVQKDLPVIQGVAVVYAIIVIVVNLVVDLMFAVLNPKVTVR
jgi:peptide/nickel transport system permease protein